MSVACFRSTVESLIPDWPAVPPAQRVALADRCTRFVHRQFEVAPFYIRIGFWGLFVSYLCFLTLRAGLRPTTQQRSEALSMFSALPLPMVYGLERLLRSATLLVYFEQPEILVALGEDTIASRQTHFRMKRQNLHTQ